jgi:ferredoxin
VMAVRQTGFALLASASVQEAHDLAVVAQAATLATRIPFLHFFDGFRTSHEINTVELLSDDDLRALVSQEPIRGLAEFTGDPEAERVIVVMGSAGQTAAETAAFLAARGEKVGVVQLRLFRPFPPEAVLAAIPPTAQRPAVLDRTKEPGSLGEPLFLDVLASLAEAHTAGDHPVMPLVVGGRYGLSSKEFTPGMDARGLPDARYTLQVYVEDCTGCGLCVEACPASAPGDPGRKAINLAAREPLVDSARRDIAFFETIPVNDRSRVDFGTVRGTQFLQPLFDFSGARRHRQLRRGHDLPGRPGRQHLVPPVPRPDRTGRGIGHPGDRQPQRQHARRVDRLRPRHAGRGRGRDRAEHLLPAR